jgi:hypothetical protein
VTAAHCTVDQTSDHKQTRRHCVKEQVFCWKCRKNRKMQLTSPTFLAIDIYWVGKCSKQVALLYCNVLFNENLKATNNLLWSDSSKHRGNYMHKSLKIKSSCFLSQYQCASRSTQRLFTWCLLTDFFLVIDTACLRWGRATVNVVQWSMGLELSHSSVRWGASASHLVTGRAAAQ